MTNNTVETRMLLKLILYVLLVEFLNILLALPDYHQNDYDVNMERVEVVWYSPSVAKDLKVIYSFYNRTQKVFNVSAYLLVNLSIDVTGTAQFYKFSSNEYRHFPMRLGANLCQEFNRNTFNLKGMLKDTSNIKSCPATMGYYYAYNMIIDFSRFPPYIPRGRYKAVGKLYHNGEFIFEGHAYGVVLDKPLKWNKKN